MALCINPVCSQPNHPHNAVHTHCQACGADLIIQGRYRVMRLLTDRSGFGRVYEIFERDQPKILKVLKETYNSHPKAVQLFEQEALVLGHLDHPGVPRIDVDGCFQIFPSPGAEPLHCIAMEKIDGPNLSEWMRQQGNHPISEKQAVYWLQQLVEVLDLVHQQRYFHRDIKPDNIMIRSSGQLVLVDFGAVREMSFTYFEQLEATGGITRISSAGYTPPEQERGQAVPQSDFYSLGCTFIYLLTGKKPTDTDIYCSMTNEYNWRPFAPHISPQLADFIDRLTAPRVVDRPTSTLELMAKVNQLHVSLHGHSDSNSDEPIPAEGERRDRPLQQRAPGLPYSVSPNSPHRKTETIPPTSSQSGTNLSNQPPIISYETYEPSSLDDGESYLVANSPGTLVHNPRRVSDLSLTLLRPKLRWLGLGLGLAVLVGGMFVGTRSLYSALVFEKDGASVPEPQLSSPLLTFNLVSQLDGHTGAVNDLALSLDQQTLVSSSNDKTVGVWDLVSGKERLRLVGHRDRVHVVAISPNNQIVASGGGDAIIKLWNLSTGEAIADLTGHTSAINALLITSDEKMLISASVDKTIKLWDLATKTEIATLMGHTSFVNTLSISPDGSTLASGSADRTIKLWNLNSLTEIVTLSGHNSPVNTVIFSLDGGQLFSGGADNQIQIWNLSTFQPIAILEYQTSFINDLKLTPDGRFLISTSADQTMVVWDLKSQQVIQTIPWPNTFINTVAVRFNGSTWQILAGGEGNHAIQIWNMKR